MQLWSNNSECLWMYAATRPGSMSLEPLHSSMLGDSKSYYLPLYSRFCSLAHEHVCFMLPLPCPEKSHAEPQKPNYGFGHTFVPEFFGHPVRV